MMDDIIVSSSRETSRDVENDLENNKTNTETESLLNNYICIYSRPVLIFLVTVPIGCIVIIIYVMLKIYKYI